MPEPLDQVAAAIDSGEPIQRPIVAAFRAGASSREVAAVIVAALRDRPLDVTSSRLVSAAHAGVDPADLLHAAFDTEVTDV